MNSTSRFAIVITSISSPNPVMKSIADQVFRDTEKKFFVIGDVKSPADFLLDGCHFFSVDSQQKLSFEIIKGLPFKHYARKNIGYLLAWRDGFECIVETDDDNFPYTDFWKDRNRTVSGTSIESKGWINVYKWFSKKNIWPRGLPLEKLSTANLFSNSTIEQQRSISPIQQGLANQNPDVDAVYRMVESLPVDFEANTPILLGSDQFCPFNSQNTTWFKEAFPLMYLPSYCSFRMTDIWRSFIAQRIAWTCDWKLTFHSATVWQERNEHNLLRDFEDEVPGYLLNEKIVVALRDLDLPGGVANIYDNLYACYKMMVERKFITSELELGLVEAWIKDCKSI